MVQSESRIDGERDHAPDVMDRSELTIPDRRDRNLGILRYRRYASEIGKRISSFFLDMTARLTKTLAVECGPRILSVEG